MKRITTFIVTAMVALMTVTTFSSCRDESIASTLDGVWRGNMYVYHSYNGHRYTSTYSEIEFINNGAFSSSGRGYWVDYYSGAPWDYIANNIRWTVDNGDIHVHFIEENTDIVIYHYSLNNRYFDGTLEDNGQSVSFRLDRISSPRYGTWDDYNYYDYNYYYGYGSYSQSKSRATTDSIETPKRGIAFPTQK